MLGKDLYTQQFHLYRDENMKNETMYDKDHKNIQQKYEVELMVSFARR